MRLPFYLPARGTISLLDLFYEGFTGTERNKSKAKEGGKEAKENTSKGSRSPRKEGKVESRGLTVPYAGRPVPILLWSNPRSLPLCPGYWVFTTKGSTRMVLEASIAQGLMIRAHSTRPLGHVICFFWGKPMARSSPNLWSLNLGLQKTNQWFQNHISRTPVCGTAFYEEFPEH